jgi:hypothetical protein
MSLQDVEDVAERRFHPLADTVTRLEAQAIIHCGHGKLYRLLRAGELEAVKDAWKTLITIESLKAYLAKRPRATFLPPAPRQNTFHLIKKKKRPTKRRRSKARA